MNSNLRKITQVYHTNIEYCQSELHSLLANFQSLPEPMMVKKAEEALQCVEEIQALIELRFEGQVPEEEDEIPF